MQLLFTIPSGAELVFMFLLILGVLTATVFWIKMIIEIATSDYSNRDSKIIWLLITIFLGFLGALIYYFAGREGRLGNSYNR